MKRFLCIVSLLLAGAFGPASAQQAPAGNRTEVLNYRLAEGGRILWQHVYRTSLSFAEVAEYLASAVRMNIVSRSENRLNAEVYGFRSGVAKSRYSFYRPEKTISFLLTVEYREGRYRVTVKDLVASKKGGTVLWGFGRGGGKEWPFERYYVSRSWRGFGYIGQEEGAVAFDGVLLRTFDANRGLAGENW